jgi:hypothetical protein
MSRNSRKSLLSIACSTASDAIGPIEPDRRPRGSTMPLFAAKMSLPLTYRLPDRSTPSDEIGDMPAKWA